MREVQVDRLSTETRVKIGLGLDGPAGGEVGTGLAFFDHMLLQLQRHGRFALFVEARGDLAVDAHHLVEDVGITLGQAFKEAIAGGYGLERYADAYVPMDETLVQVVVDFSGRSHLAFAPEELGNIGSAGGMNPYHLREFLRGLANHAGLTLHLRVLAGREPHHLIEASFKALALALHGASRLTRDDLPSTKGLL